MRIIIKPLGLIVMGGAVVALIAIPRFRSTSSSAPVSVVPRSSSSAPLSLPTDTWNIYGNEGGEATRKPAVPNAPRVPTAGAVHLDIQKVGKNPWSVGMVNSVISPLTEGEPLTFRFWARADQPHPVRVALQLAAEPFTEAWGTELTLTPDWKQYTFSFPAKTFAASKANVVFHLGSKPGWVELSGMTLERRSK